MYIIGNSPFGQGANNIFGFFFCLARQGAILSGRLTFPGARRPTMTLHYPRILHSTSWRYLAALILLLAIARALGAQGLEPVAVEGQPLANNVQRLLQALDFLGAPLPAK